MKSCLVILNKVKDLVLRLEEILPYGQNDIGRAFPENIKRQILLSAILLLFSFRFACADIPERPTGYVSDFANILSEKNKSEINLLITGVEQKTSAEIAVATVSSLEGMTVEEYANRLFKQWGIGKKGKDNGILVLVAPNERKVRIEVGYGLEPVLPDGLAGEIIRQQFIPAFKSGDFNGGILAGVKRISEIIGKGEIPSGDKTFSDYARESAGKKLDKTGIIFLGVFMSAFIIPGFFMVGAGFGSKMFFGIFWGIFFGGVPFVFIFSFKLGILINIFFMLLAAGSFLSGIFYGKRNPSSLRYSSRRRSSGSGWVWGASGGGGFGGGGGGGGFGGGSSGGGGASGSW